MSTYLLETTICSHLMKENLMVKERLDKLTALDAYFTIPIVQGEILYGIELLEIGRRQRYLSQRANSLFEGIECNPLPKETGIYYAQLRRQAEQQGTRLHDNDLWIAAAALAFDAILVTSDRDFYRVQGLLGLQLENWLITENVRIFSHGCAFNMVQQHKTVPKFLADENVGKLGRWLRILGYDVAYQSPALDAQLALKALRENRIILTRDREFVERRMVERYLLLSSQDPVEQLKQVIQTFGLKLDRNSFFTRCLDCNTPIESVPKAEVRSVVPDYVYRTQDQFHRCPTCNKLFWAGSHTTNFQDWLKRVGEEKK